MGMSVGVTLPNYGPLANAGNLARLARRLESGRGPREQEQVLRHAAEALDVLQARREDAPILVRGALGGLLRRP